MQVSCILITVMDFLNTLKFVHKLNIILVRDYCLLFYNCANIVTSSLGKCVSDHVGKISK